jgi:hypothetical protein
MAWVESLWQALWNPVANVVGAAFGAFIAHLWMRYRNRMAVLRWSYDCYSSAASSEDEVVGRIEVLLNGDPVRHLKWCFVRLVNDSTRDLIDVEVNLSFPRGEQFHGGGGWVAGSTVWFDLAERIRVRIERLVALGEHEREGTPDLLYVQTHRDFRIGVLNRGARADFAFLVHSEVPENPVLLLSCDHAGVKVRQEPPRPMLLGVAQQHAQWVGLTMGTLATIAVAVSVRSPWGAVAGYVVGVFATLIGVVVLRLVRLASRVLS